MQLVRFDPFSTMREFDRLFEGRPGNRWMPRVDVFDQDNELMVRAEVPGVDPESIEVTWFDGTLQTVPVEEGRGTYVVVHPERGG